METNRQTIIFADSQKENPVYLCMDDLGELYTCTVGQQDGKFFEQDREKVSCVEAQIFITNASLKARKIVSECETLEEQGKPYRKG